MAEFQPVPIGRPPPRSWLPALGSVLVLIVALGIVKPWQPAATVGSDAGFASPSAAVAIHTPTPRSDRDTYDPRLFGNREPDPAWELWPAGYVVEFGMAGPVDVHGQESAPPSGGPAASLAPGASAPRPASSPPPSPPLPARPGEHVVDLGPADHLIALGINTPTEVRVLEIRLWAEGRGSCDFCVAVQIVRLPTLWESDHFAVIGIANPERPGDTGPWIPGEYRLELETLGGEVRSVRLRVSAPLD